MTDLKGFRIYEIQNNGVPREIKSGNNMIEDFANWFVHDMNIEKTYAIRIGKNGLK